MIIGGALALTAGGIALSRRDNDDEPAPTAKWSGASADAAFAAYQDVSGRVAYDNRMDDDEATDLTVAALASGASADKAFGVYKDIAGRVVDGNMRASGADAVWLAVASLETGASAA